MNGKGSRQRTKNWASYRSNYDLIFKKKYPDWICGSCGRIHGKRPEGNPYGATYHVGTCGICGEEREVTEPRDYGHLKEGWDK